MKYALLSNFVPSGSYEGQSGVDSHGKYILFPPDVYGMITSSDFLKTATGDLIQIIEDSSEVINGTRYLKLYYK